MKDLLAFSKEWRAIAKWSSRVAVLLLVVFCVPGGLRAQDTGYISGTVTDSSGAAVANAQVALTNVAGSLTRNTTTNADGAYVIPALPGGTYNLTVAAPGFQKYSAQRIVLTVAQKARVDVQLTVGAVTQEVVVSGGNVAQVDTESAELSTTITGKQVDRLELNGRNFTQLVNLVPGVVSQTGQDEGAVGVAGNVSYSVNGGRVEYNNWEIDGGENMDNGSNATLNVYPNLEAIAEFKVLTSNYGAQYGRNGSGTVEVETKSGTKDFHGSAFYYGRNDFFNANSWANNSQALPRSAYKKHDYGYTIGGPVFIPGHYNSEKKKTFFFWSQEWRHEIVPGNLGTIQQNVPSGAERQGNFNDVCPAYTGAAFAAASFPDCPYQSGSLTSSGNGTPFVNNTVPLTQTGQALLQIIPQANGSLGTYATGQAAGQPLPAYVSANSYPTTWREELVRIDHNLTDNQRLTFRYIHDSWKQLYQGPLWSAFPSNFDNINTNFEGPGTSFVARLTSNFTPTLLNEFVASYTADHIILSATGNGAIPSGGIDLVPLFSNGLGGKLPAVSVGNTNGVAYGSGGFAEDTGYFPWKNANPTYSYRDNLTKTLGNHTLLLGAYFAAVQKNQESSVNVQGQLSFATSNPNSTGNPFADLLTGQVSKYTQTNKQLFFYDRYKIFEPYVQDDWRITKRLTLNLGLRWSFFGRYQEKFNQEFGFSVPHFNSANAPQLFPFNDPNGNAGLLVPGTGNQFNGLIQCGATGIETGCMQNKLMNPAPRFGFAFDPRGDGKWAIRGGYGIFFEHSNGNEANAESLQGSPTTSVFNGTVNNISGYANVGAGAQTAPSPLAPTSLPDRVQWPYVQQWNLGVQHELPSHLLLSVAYVGSKGTHLTRQRDINQLHAIPASQNPYTAGEPIVANDCQNFVTDPNTGLPVSTVIGNGSTVTGQAAQNLFIACGNAAANYYRPFPGFDTITRLDTTANSIYNALQVSAQRTVGDLSFSLAYTYSHSIDDSSDRYDSLFADSYNPKMARAASNFDLRHNLTVSYVYSLPFFKQAGLTHTLLGGWQASGITTIQSGLPLTIKNGTTYSDNAGVSNASGTGSFPDLIGDPYAVTPAQQAAVAAAGVTGKLYYNPAAFTLPTGLTFGNVGRNSLRMPGRTSFDFGLFKRFAFKERYAFEFRWENFNLFNHTQFNGFAGSGANAGGTGATSVLGCVDAGNGGGPNCASSGFLVLNQTHLPRIMQFGLRFQF